MFIDEAPPETFAVLGGDMPPRQDAEVDYSVAIFG